MLVEAMNFDSANMLERQEFNRKVDLAIEEKRRLL